MVKVDKDVVFERVMRAGERLAYNANTSVTLSAGNAGGLTLTINGKPARPLGTTGQVVTATITLDTLSTFLQ
jgi:urease beta subunit